MGQRGVFRGVTRHRCTFQTDGGGTFGARVPQSDVSVAAARGQPSTERRVGNTVEHLAASLRRRQNRQHVGPRCDDAFLLFLCFYMSRWILKFPHWDNSIINESTSSPLE